MRSKLKAAHVAVFSLDNSTVLSYINTNLRVSYNGNMRLFQSRAGGPIPPTRSSETNSEFSKLSWPVEGLWDLRYFCFCHCLNSQQCRDIWNNPSLDWFSSAFGG